MPRRRPSWLRLQSQALKIGGSALRCSAAPLAASGNCLRPSLRDCRISTCGGAVAQRFGMTIGAGTVPGAASETARDLITLSESRYFSVTLPLLAGFTTRAPDSLRDTSSNMIAYVVQQALRRRKWRQSMPRRAAARGVDRAGRRRSGLGRVADARRRVRAHRQRAVRKGEQRRRWRLAARQLAAKGVRVRVFDVPSHPGVLPPSDLVIDAAYGTGFHGTWRPPTLVTLRCSRWTCRAAWTL